MKSSEACKSCRKRTIVTDDASGKIECTSCGLVQQSGKLLAYISSVPGDIGTKIRVGTAGDVTVHNYKEMPIKK